MDAILTRIHQEHSAVRSHCATRLRASKWFKRLHHKRASRENDIRSVLNMIGGAARASLLSEQENRAGLRARKPGFWRRMVTALDEPYRTKVAQIIWWDFFSLKPVATGWSHLDKLVAGYRDELEDQVDTEEMIKILVRFGYTPHHAVERVMTSLLETQ